MEGRESQLRIVGSVVLEPSDVNSTGFLQVWAYDQRKLPGFYSYQPTTKRVRSYPVDQRFEPLFPGNTYFVTEYYMAGDPSYYERKPGMKWIEGTPDTFVSWSYVHA